MVRCCAAVIVALVVVLALAQTPEEANAPGAAAVPAPLTQGPASEASRVSSEAMRDAMHTYVRSERRSIVPFGRAALSTLTAAGLLLPLNDPLARGAAWPLLGFGVLELADDSLAVLRHFR